MAATTAAGAMFLSTLGGLASGFTGSLLGYIIVALLITLAGLWFSYKFYKELSAITDVNLFMMAFYLYAIGAILFVFSVDT